MNGGEGAGLCFGYFRIIRWRIGALHQTEHGPQRIEFEQRGWERRFSISFILSLTLLRFLLRILVREVVRGFHE